MPINPVQRLRDFKRYTKPQQKISFEEWEQIKERALKAKTFFKEDNLIYTTLKQSLTDAENIILENRVKEVRDVHTISDTLKKIFITSREIQYDELVGQIKFIRTFLAELQSWVDFKSTLEKQEANGKILIERTEREDSEKK